MGDPNLPAGCGNLPNDDGICSVCNHTMDLDGDSDGVRQWNVWTCLNNQCPESPKFNEDDPRGER